MINQFNQAHFENLLIEEINLEGAGVSQTEDFEVRVNGAFPGDRVVAKVEHQSRHNHILYAKLLNLIEPSKDRRAVPCSNDITRGGRCTGCALLPIEESAQHKAKAKLVERITGYPVTEFIHGKPLHYRYSSKRIAFGLPGDIRLGSFRRGSHQYADMKGCLVEHPLIVQSVDDLIRKANLQKMIPYLERKERGELRYVWFKTNGKQVLVTAVMAEIDIKAARIFAESLQADGVSIMLHAAQDNSLRGGEVLFQTGLKKIDIELANIASSIGPLGFLQPNPEIAERAYLSLVSDIEGQPIEGNLAFDLYAGVGITTALLKKSFKQVIPCESYEESAEILGVQPMSVKDFLQNALIQLAEKNERPDLIIANPPRSGIGTEQVQMLKTLGAQRIHVMSCHPQSLQKDLQSLLAPEGPYRLEKLEAFDTLPQTPHIELVAKLVHSECESSKPLEG